MIFYIIAAFYIVGIIASFAWYFYMDAELTKERYRTRKEIKEIIERLKE